MCCRCIYVIVYVYVYEDIYVDVYHYVYNEVYEKLMFMCFVSVCEFGCLSLCFVNV